MYAATPLASRSSRSCAGSPVMRAVTTTSVGARSSLPDVPGLACSSSCLSRSRAFGPTTRNRHGLVRWWLGAQRASSNKSSSVWRSTGSGRYALWVRRLRMASSTCIGQERVGEVERQLEYVGVASARAEAEPPQQGPGRQVVDERGRVESLDLVVVTRVSRAVRRR